MDTKIQEYWTERSKTYSDSVMQELYGDDAKNWENLIYNIIDKNSRLKVLDIGTGPGMFAVLMGKNMNYKVFAIDSSEGMLEQAQQNADKFGVKVDFKKADAHLLPFENESIDVILTRNVTWNLPEPEKAYQEWKRVLKQGGKMINFDSNWYLRLFNEDLQKYHSENPDKKLQKVWSDKLSARMDMIAKKLPLSQQKRPAWDVNCLMDLGFDKMSFDYNLNELIYNVEKQKVNAKTPMFMITATK